MKKFMSGVVLLFFVGFFLRVVYLNKSATLFTYDQARDAFVVRQILNGDLKIQGPSANAPGLNHGVLYYYFLVPPYYFSNGSPLAAGYWLAVYSMATIFVVFFLCHELTQNKLASLLSAVFFAFSFKATQYATWLSNPSMALWFIPLTYLTLLLWTQKRKGLYALLAGLFFGLSVQSDLFLIYHGIAILTWLIINRRSVIWKQISYFSAAFALGISSILISEVKFGFQGLKGLAYLFSGGDSLVSGKGLGDFIVIYLNQLGDTIALNLFPLSLGLGGFIGLLIILWLVGRFSTKQKVKLASWEMFLLIYIFSHLPVVFLGGLSSPYLTVGIDIAVCIMAGIFVSTFWKKSWATVIFLSLVIIVPNLIKIIGDNKSGQTIFALRKGMTLSNIEQVIDYTYRASNGNKFSINTITAPLWMNTTWSYIYNWYGYEKYGFLPYWHGRNQVGVLGGNLVDTPKNVLTYFLILEPKEGIPGQFINEAISEENSKSKIVEETNFGGIIVQKRLVVK